MKNFSFTQKFIAALTVIMNGLLGPQYTASQLTLLRSFRARTCLVMWCAVAALSAEELSAQYFVDVSDSVGVNHRYRPTDMFIGGGAVFFDYDNDGWEDLYLNSGLREDHLYKNLGNGNFERVEGEWLAVTGQLNTTGVVSADFNNDGYRDLFVTTGANNLVFDNTRNILFLNNGDGTFVDVTEDFGIGESKFAAGALVLDYDRDGYLDIYIINYIEDLGFRYGDNGINGFSHLCYADALYRNIGGERFEEVTDSLGIDNRGCTLGGVPLDWDKDFDQDLYIINDFGQFIIPNKLYLNESNDNFFVDTSASVGLDVGLYGMGVAYGDIDKDQDYDFYIVNIGENFLMLNDNNESYTEIALEAGVDNTFTRRERVEIDFDVIPNDTFRIIDTVLTTGWGTAFVDLDNDSWLDLLVSNGLIPTAEELIPTSMTDPNKVYRNLGDGTFEDISLEAGIDIQNQSRGLAYCDYDKDGDIDFVINNYGRTIEGIPTKTILYKNTLNEERPNDNNWMQIELAGQTINPQAIGTRVELEVNGEVLVQEVHGQGSHASQHSLVLHYGIGEATAVDVVRIYWSPDNIQELYDLDINERHLIIENDITVSTVESTPNPLKIYPNPASQWLHIAGLNPVGSLSIMDITGQSVAHYQVQQEQLRIPLTQLPNGVYWLQYHDPSSRTSFYRKLIVQH